MPRPKAKTESAQPIVSTDKFTKEEAMAIIESAARGTATKQQADAAQEWLKINGQGDVFTKYFLEIKFADKPNG